MSLPVVAIVGRPNVGKSSLLNALAGRRISIVDPTPGVTRDRVSTTIALGEADRFVELLDTGGMGIEDHDRLTDEVEGQIRFGLDQAALLLFVVDGREGITPLDRHVAKVLRRQDKPILLVANKIDQGEVVQELGDVMSLGFGEPLGVSAMHKRGLDDLTDAIEAAVEHVPVQPRRAEGMKLAIVGKRNAGKSTLINALTGQQRVIVSQTPGTTRDSVDVDLEFEGQQITLIDTAGMKKNRKLASDIEFYSQHRALRSIRRADVVAMVIDASLPVSQVDKALAGTIAEEFRPCLIVVNKWDLAHEATEPEAYMEYFAKTFPELSYAPIIFTSATQGLNVAELIGLACELYTQSRHRVPTGQLNAAMAEILQLRGPSHKGGTKPPKIYYASQVDVDPPTIICFVNDPASFDESYRRFLVNQFREHLPYDEVPIRLFLRARREKK
jgi:GTPase